MKLRSGIWRWLRGVDVGVPGKLARVLLVPFAVLYGMFMALRRRLLRPVRVPLPVLSVGNLELGGTGKSPCVRWLALLLAERGLKVLVVSRGYGARVDGALDEEGAELATHGVRVVQGRERARVITGALKQSKADLVLLDDGFQQCDVAVDFHILLLDARRPFGAGWTLPAGSLRECPMLVPAPDILVLTRVDAVDAATHAAARRLVERRFPDVPILAGRQTVSRSGGPLSPALKGRRVHLLAAIARPEEFLRLAQAEDALVTGTTFMPDHHAWTPDEVRAAAERGAAEGADGLLTTGKDLPKVGGVSTAIPLGVLQVGFALDPGGVTAFEAALKACLPRNFPTN